MDVAVSLFPSFSSVIDFKHFETHKSLLIQPLLAVHACGGYTLTLQKLTGSRLYDMNDVITDQTMICIKPLKDYVLYSTVCLQCISQ